MSAVDDKFVQAFRAKLVAEGAVAYFDNPSDFDQAASRATAGLVWGIPGSGLYAQGDGVYTKRLEDRYPCHVERYYHELTADEWRSYLAEREPRAVYISHLVAQGTHNGMYWKQVILKFRIEVIE